jgi:hypothetical protein
MPDIHLTLDPDTGGWPPATGLKPGKTYTIILEGAETNSSIAAAEEKRDNGTLKSK